MTNERGAQVQNYHSAYVETPDEVITKAVATLSERHLVVKDRRHALLLEFEFEPDQLVRAVATVHVAKTGKDVEMPVAFVPGDGDEPLFLVRDTAKGECPTCGGTKRASKR